MPQSANTIPTVREVVALVRDWVDEYACHLPDFAGAYTWGGITALPDDAPFPLYRDIDVIIVSTAGSREGEDEILYHGLMLEVGTKGLGDLNDVEAALASPSFAPNIVVTTILADPTGTIAPFQAAVRARFTERRWIEARCASEKRMARDFLAAMRRATVPVASVNDLWLVMYALSGLMAVATLGRPTTRRTLALLGELLDTQGRTDLHEEVLRVWGSADMSRADVEAMLAQTLIAHERAIAVYTTPTEMGFTLQTHLRPYLVEGSQEMIEQGLHREATFWIQAHAGESYQVLANDAPEAEKPGYVAEFEALHATLGYSTLEAWHARCDATERLIEEVFRVADRTVAMYPE